VNNWAPNSLPISGSRTSARSGFSVALSGNGVMLAIGEPRIDAVRLLSKDGSKWIEQEFLEGPPGSGFGGSVVMSGGSTNVVNNPSGRAPVTIAISARGNLYQEGGPGMVVRVYDCTTLRCIQVGEDLLGSGYYLPALAMSGNGEYLAVGGDTGSSVRVYRASNLDVRGGDIMRDEDKANYFGEALSLSGNGDVLAVGSKSRNRTFLVQMFKWNGISYAFDTEIEIEIDNAYTPQAVVLALSSDAMVLAIALPSDNYVYAPAVEVYQRTQTDSNWTKRANITDSCCSVDMSSDGSIISVGTSEVGSSVRTYKWNNTDYEQLWNDIPGGEETALALSDNGSVLAVGLPSSEFNRGGTTVYGFLSDLCGDGTNRFRLSLTFDDFPEGTRWDLKSSSSVEKTVMEGGEGRSYDNKYSLTTLVEETCLKKDECFIFTLFDEDGITLPGGYSIYLNGEEHYNGIGRNGGHFLSCSHEISIGNCTCGLSLI
jgi:hypothetical protein